MRAWLRALPTFPGSLPPFDPGSAPASAVDLFTTWLTEAAAGGTPVPHAAVLSTADGEGTVSARTLILKDIDDDGGWVFATQSTSPKARDLAANPHAALTFFWAGQGRQVRLQGPVRQLPAATGAEDFRARPPGSRAGCITGRQSAPLASVAQYHQAYDDALARVRADPDLIAQHWAAYALYPQWVEFWQATTDRGQIRLRYTRAADTWDRGLLWP